MVATSVTVCEDPNIKQHGKQTASRTDWFLLLLLTLSLTVNVWLGITVKRLRLPIQSTSAVGQNLRDLPIMTLDHRPASINVKGSHKTVLYVISPSCKWCEINEANINALASARGNDYDFIGLSLTDQGLHEFLRTHPLPFVVYSLAAPSDSHQIHFDVTPQTLLLSSEGIVLRRWNGAYIGQTQHEIEDEFHMKFNKPVSRMQAHSDYMAPHS